MPKTLLMSSETQRKRIFKKICGGFDIDHLQQVEYSVVVEPIPLHLGLELLHVRQPMEEGWIIFEVRASFVEPQGLERDHSVFVELLQQHVG